MSHIITLFVTNHLSQIVALFVTTLSINPNLDDTTFPIKARPTGVSNIPYLTVFEAIYQRLNSSHGSAFKD